MGRGIAEQDRLALAAEQRGGQRLGGVAGGAAERDRCLGAGAFGEPDNAYTPDPELDFAIDDAEGLWKALTDGPVLVAGNGLVN